MDEGHSQDPLSGGGRRRLLVYRLPGANRVQPTNSKGGNWWQSPFCGVSRPASPKTVKHPNWMAVPGLPREDDKLVSDACLPRKADLANVLRPSTLPHRLLAARRRLRYRPVDEDHGRTEDARRGHDRSRQSVRRGEVL